MRVFPVRGKGMAVHAKRFFARRRVIHRSCGEQTLRALLASMNNSGGTISLRVQDSLRVASGAARDAIPPVPPKTAKCGPQPPKSAMESHLRFAETSVSTDLLPRANSLPSRLRPH